MVWCTLDLHRWEESHRKQRLIKVATLYNDEKDFIDMCAALLKIPTIAGCGPLGAVLELINKIFFESADLMTRLKDASIAIVRVDISVLLHSTFGPQLATFKDAAERYCRTEDKVQLTNALHSLDNMRNIVMSESSLADAHLLETLTDSDTIRGLASYHMFLSYLLYGDAEASISHQKSLEMVSRVKEAYAKNVDVFVSMLSEDYTSQKYLELKYFDERTHSWEERSSWYSQLHADYQGWYTIEHAKIPSSARDIRIRFGVRGGHQPTYEWKNDMWTGKRDNYEYAHPGNIENNVFCLSGTSFNCAVTCNCCSIAHSETFSKRRKDLQCLDAIQPALDAQFCDLVECNAWSRL